MKPQPFILGETFTFSRTYWKSFRVIYALIFYPVFLLFFLSNRHLSHELQIIVISLLAISFLITIRIWGFLTRVTISPEGLTYSTPFRTKTVEWSYFKTTGMYILYKNSREELAVHRYAEKFYLKEKFIFLARQPNYSPGFFSFFESDFFDFHYREKAWELIEFYLGKKEKQGSAYL